MGEVQRNFRVSPEELALIEQKMAQLGTTNREAYLRKMCIRDSHYTPFTAEWQISGKNVVGQNNVAAYSTYGTSRANAYKKMCIRDRL